MIEAFITILIVYLVYFFVSVARYDKDGHLKNKSKNISDYDGLPTEIKYFIKKYNIDLEKINLRGLLKLSGLILGFDIAIVSIPVVLIFKDKVVLQLVISSLLIVPVYLISLKFLGKYFKKRGICKDV